MIMRKNGYLFFLLVFLFLLPIAHDASGLTVNYEYDELYRLTKVTRSDGMVITYQYDESGNRRSKITTVVDTTPPASPTVSGVALTNNQKPTWSWLSGGDGNGTYRYKFDSSDLTNGATETTATSFTTQTNLSDGTNTLYVQERDAAGNWSASGSFTITVDTISPATTASPSGNTYVASLAVSLSANETATIYYTTDNSDPTTSSSIFNQGTPIQISTTTILKYFAKDPAGNSEPVKAQSYVINAAPGIINGLPDGTSLNRDYTVTVSGVGIASYKYKVDNGQWSSEMAGGVPITLTGLIAGHHTLYIIVKDQLGQWQSEGNATSKSWDIAGNAPLSGMVKDISSGLPLQGAEINLNGPSSSTVFSGADGRYAFNQLLPGSYTITAAAGGYVTAQSSLTLSDTSSVLDLLLKKALEVQCNQTALENCRTVKAYVTITNKDDQPVTGLVQSDFTVSEDGVSISTFDVNQASSTSAISVAFTMDYSGSMVQDNAIANMQTAAENFISKMGPDDAGEIIKFSSQVEVVQPYTTNKSALTSSVTSNWSYTGNSTAFYDAVYKAITDTASRTGRKAILAMTDGMDTLPSTHSLGTVINYAISQGVPIFAIGLGDAQTDILQQMANATGGKYYYAPTSADLLALYQTIADVLQNQYVISYVTGKQDGQTHTLSVQASANGYTSTGISNFAACSPTFTELKAVYQSANNQNYVTWNAVAGATTYNLYWSTSPDVTTSSNFFSTQDTFFTHTGLVASPYYYYRVSAVTAGGETPLSPEISVDTALPQITVMPQGGLYNQTVNVTLTSNEPATIYYTADGSNPTIGSPVFNPSASITINSSTTLKFFAVDNAGNASAVQTQIYTIDIVPPIVTPSSVGGAYTESQTITLTADEPGATIYYTLDGSIPTTSSSVYTSPILITATTTLKFFAVDQAGNQEAIQTEQYTICSYTIEPLSINYVSAGGAGSITVSTSQGCPWSAASNVSWIIITSGNNGAGTGAVNYSVGTNTDPQRTGTLTINGITFSVVQDGSSLMPVATWMRKFGTANDDMALGVQQTNDGGYVLAGRTGSRGWVMKLGEEGTVEWQKSYSEQTSSYFNTIRLTSDGGYILAGQVDYDAWVVKLDANGDIKWQKIYSGPYRDWTTYGIQQTNDGGYIVGGVTQPSGTDSDDYWIIKLDSVGNIEWQKIYGNPGIDYLNDIHQTTDGGYIAVGEKTSADNFDIWVVKLDSTGNIVWQKSYGGLNDDYALSTQETTDGGYIVGGWTFSYGAGNSDAWALKLDADGDIIWQKAYGGLNADIVYHIRQASDGGYIAAGLTRSFNEGSYDTWLIKLDAEGDIQWQKTYGSQGSEQATSVFPTFDGGYIVSGLTDSNSLGQYDIVALKLDGNGNINGCPQDLIRTTNVSPIITEAVATNTNASQQNAAISTILGSSSVSNLNFTANYVCLADTTPPTVTNFSVPSLINLLTVPITSLAASDNTGVTGYMVTESSIAPATGVAGWSATVPVSYTFTTEGVKTLYAWAKDAAGNISESKSASVNVDTTAPTVTAFSIPATSNNLTIVITTFSATDNVGITGYMARESGVAPKANDPGWNVTPPTSYAFISEGAKTLYAWAKDVAGNVSANLSATVVLTLPDITPPASSIVSGVALTNNPKPTWSWSSGGGGNGTYRYRLDSSDLASGATETTATSYTPQTNLSDGPHTLYVQERDAAVNWSVSGSYTITVDTTAPVTTASPSGNTYVGSLSVSLSANETATIYYTTDNSDPTTSSSIFNQGTPIQISATAILKYFAKDTAGTSESVKAQTYLINAAPGTINGLPDGVSFNRDYTVTISGTGIAAYKYKLDNGQWSGEMAGGVPISLTGLLAGHHTLYIIVKDQLGQWQNEGNATTKSWDIVGNASLSGMVKDISSGLPLQSTEINLNGPSSSTVFSGADGRYAFNQLLPGSYTVTAAAVGYVTAQSSLTLSATSSVLDLLLKKALEVQCNQIALENCRTVKAYVTVTDKDDQPVTGLVQSDFTVSEDGISISTFEVNQASSTSAISVAFTMDYSGSMVQANAIANMQTAAANFISKMRPDDAGEIIKFSSQVEVVQPFTTNKSALTSSVTSNWSYTGNSTAFNDAVYKAITDTASRTGRKVILAMTDGMDTLPSTHSLDTVVNSAISKGVPIFAIGLGDAQTDILQQMANATGGKYYYAPTSADLLTLYQTIADVLQNQYVISYVTNKQAGQTHTLSVQASVNGYTSASISNFLACSPTPTELTAVYQSANNQNYVTWNAVVGATTYNLYWSTSPVVTASSNFFSTQNAFFTHTGLVAAPFYYYRVSAVTAAGETPLSPEISVDTALPQITVTPQGGLYNQTLNVTLTSDEPATIYYTTDSSHPTIGSPAFNPSAPITINSSTTLKFFAVDNAGNASAVQTQIYTIDTTVPTVTAFALPATSTTLTVPITTLTATDNTGGSGVTGYMVTESSAAPNAGTAGWSTTAPISYTFPAAGAKTLYAWAKDAVSNVSSSLSAPIIVDTTAPTVTSFNIPVTSNTLTVAITAITVADNVGVTGYMVTESDTAPSVSDPRWSATVPANYTFATAGAKTLYAWAKDIVGNVSRSLSASVTIDTTAPTVTAFNLPGTSSSLIVYITTFTATDNIGVTGYMVTEFSSTPKANDPGWSAASPTSYTFTTAGAKMLYAWVKDAAGNVSVAVSATVNITSILDLSGDWLMSFSMIKTVDSSVTATTKQTFFPVTTSGNGFSAFFSLDDTTYTLINFTNDEDLMVYFTLDIKEGTGTTISTKGRGKVTIEPTNNRTWIRGDFAYASSGLSLEGIFETHINTPQATDEIKPAIININQNFDKFGCTDTLQDGAGSLNTYYDININADNTFTGNGGDGSAISNGKISGQLIRFTIGSKNFAGITQDLDISGVFSDHDANNSCNTLGTFTMAIMPSPADRQMEILSPAHNVLTGTSFTLPIMANTGTTLFAAYNLKLKYDPKVLHIISVVGGTTTGWTDNPNTNVNNTLGETGFVATNANTPSVGVANFAKVTAKAVGDTGSTTTINLISNEITDENANDIVMNAIFGGDLSIDKARVYVGSTNGYYDTGTGDAFNVPIIIGNAGDRVIGEYDFTLKYDPTVAFVTEILGGTTPEFASILTSNLDNAQTTPVASVRWNAKNSNATSPVGAANVALIKFSVPNTAPDQSKTFLTLIVNELVDANNKNLGVDTIGNVVTVSGGRCGNVNGDRDVNGNEKIGIGDALFIAQYLVGKRTLDEKQKRLANVNGDTKVGIGDALFIAQYLVGKRDYTAFKCIALTP